MHRLDNEVINSRIEQIEQILNKELELDENLTDIEKYEFIKNLLPYLKHSRTNDLAGRKTETLDNNLKKYIKFAQCVGLNKREIIQSIENFPSIINSIDKDFINKYLFLGIVENQDNTLRKNYLINKPRYFNPSLELVYARYNLMSSLNYEPITFNNLMKISNNDFSKIFVKTSYEKPYKIFDSIEELTKERLISMFPVKDDFIIDMGLTSLPCNETIANNYINKQYGM